jgi:hypothetical protein
MLSTSLDLFWVALAFAVLWIGIASGFAIFYFAMLVRNIWCISESIKKKVEAVEKVVTAFRGKVENTASYVPPLIEGISKIIEAVAEKKKTQATHAKKRKR